MQIVLSSFRFQRRQQACKIYSWPPISVIISALILRGPADFSLLQSFSYEYCTLILLTCNLVTRLEIAKSCPLAMNH